MKPELKVGLLFFIGLALILTFTLFVTDWHSGGSDFSVRFPRVSRLKQSDGVTYNGVRVGSISAVTPVLSDDGRPLVEVKFTVDNNKRKAVLIDAKTEFRIVQGLLGGATMEISSSGGHPLKAQGDLAGLVGTEPIGIDETLSSVRAMIDENRAEVREAIKSLRSGIKNFGEMSGEIRDVVKENRGAIGDAVTNVGSMSEAIRQVVKENQAALKTAMDNLSAMLAENRESVKTAVLHIGGAAANIEAAVGDNRDDLRKVMAGLANAAPRLDKISANLELITQQVAEGKGTIGKLVMEDTLHTKSVQAVDSFNQRLEEVKPVTSGFSQLKFIGGIDYGTNVSSGSSTSSAYIRIEPRSWKFYQAGASYRTEPDSRTSVREDPDKLHVDFTFVLGWRFLANDAQQNYRLSIAAGLVETQLGGWVETPVWRDRLALRVLLRHKDNGRDTDDRRYEKGQAMLRATAELRLWQRVSLIAGGDDLIDKPGLWVGVRGELLDNDLRNMVTLAAFKP